MNEINKHKRVWRTAALVLLVMAFIGPWAFEEIHVPAEYPCSPPYTRVEGDFCSVPGWKGTHVLIIIVGGFFASIVQLVTGSGPFFPDPAGSLLRAFFLLPLILPFLALLLSILRRDRQQLFHVVAWGLAALAAGLFLALGNDSFSRILWALWGILLYIGLAVSMLALELLALVASRKSVHASLG
jgi:hypothetical protein